MDCLIPYNVWRVLWMWLPAVRGPNFQAKYCMNNNVLGRGDAMGEVRYSIYSLWDKIDDFDSRPNHDGALYQNKVSQWRIIASVSSEFLRKFKN